MEIEILPTSKFADKKITELNLSEGIIIGAILREKDVYFADDEFTLQINDKLILFSDSQSIKEVEKFSELFEDTQFRILSGIISWFSGKFYKPRFSQLENMQNKILNGKLTGATLGGTVFKEENGIITVTRELASIEGNYLVTEDKFVWDNRWLITLKSGTQGKLYVKPYGLLGLDDHSFSITSEFDKNALAPIPTITTNKSVKFVPLSNLEYDIDIKLLNQDNEFYKFF